MMDGNCRISIIMPVYNTPEAFLRTSVQSVLDQSFSDFELILVDDGSSEQCRALCGVIAQTDRRIRLITRPNGGVSAARNTGTEHACGDYVMYVDSDDILTPTALEEGVSVIERTKAKFIFAAVQHIKKYDDLKKEAAASVDCVLFDRDRIDEVRHSFLTRQNPAFSAIGGAGFVNTGPCARLIEANTAKSVRFNQRLRLGEDVEWNMRILNACDTVCFVPRIWYGYLIYGTSSLRRYYGNRMELLEDYHRELYKNNAEYCRRDPGAYGMNMAISFYSMVRYEFMSPECPLTEAEKNRAISDALNRKPWTILRNSRVNRSLMLRHRVFLALCRQGLGLRFLRLWEGLSAWKRKV